MTPSDHPLLTDRHLARLAEMVSCGIPLAAAGVAAKVLEQLAPNDIMGEWSVFASLDADPPELELWHEQTGTMVKVSVSPS